MLNIMMETVQPEMTVAQKYTAMKEVADQISDQTERLKFVYDEVGKFSTEELKQIAVVVATLN